MFRLCNFLFDFGQLLKYYAVYDSHEQITRKAVLFIIRHHVYEFNL